MAVIDTGWIEVQNGQQTQVTVPAGRVVSARVRWRGKQVTSTSTTTTSNSASGSASASHGQLLSASSPGGEWSLAGVSGSASVSAGSSGSWWASAWAGGTGSAQFNSGTGLGGSASQTNWSPSAAHAQLSVAHDNPFNYSFSVTAHWSRSVTYQTQNPQITVDGSVTAHSGTLNDGVESGWYSAGGFAAGQVNTAAHAVSGSSRAWVQIEITYIPALTVSMLEPAAFGRATRASLVFRAQANQPDDNTATAWHLRLLAGQEPELTTPDFIWDSLAVQDDWDYTTDGGENWTPLTSDGAPLDAVLRFTPPADDMAMGRWYWRGAAWDDDTEVWGVAAAIRQFRLVLSIAARFALEIDGVDFSSQALNITVSETTNGELGSIRFDLVLPSGEEELPSDGDPVALAVRDVAGTEEQFEGWLQGNPERAGPGLFRCYCKLPDAILAGRYVRVDYGSQDVGLTAKAVVDNYCAPLDSSGIDTSTGFVRPVTAFGRTALDVLKELREQYGLLFWVRSTDSVVFLQLPEDLLSPVLTVTRGKAA